MTARICSRRALLCLIIAGMVNQVSADDFINTGRGTLDVVLATPRFIVVTTDSRRTNLQAGGYEDVSKKLFVVERTRILAIAGLADISLPFAGLTAQIAPLLDIEIVRSAGHNDYFWNDPAPPSDLPAEFKKSWGADPYIWWTALAGPIQTITHIAATYQTVPLDNLALIGLLAGFKRNGEAKIEQLVMIPQRGTSSWGRPYIGTGRARSATTTSGSLIWKTTGMTALADVILGGAVTPQLEKFCESYPGLKNWLKRRTAGTQDQITEAEMISLAEDLIRATAAVSVHVGPSPIQLATVRPGREVELRQPAFPTAKIFLPSEGTWHMGVVFTPDFPFDERKANVVFTFSEIKDNRTPIPLGNNHFYGNTFERATFVYEGGSISFANNRVRDSKLVLRGQPQEAALAPILSLFSSVDRQPGTGK